MLRLVELLLVRRRFKLQNGPPGGAMVANRNQLQQLEFLRIVCLLLRCQSLWTELRNAVADHRI